MAKVNPNPHKFMSPEWFRWTHNQHERIHRQFCRWVSERRPEIYAVLEIGCGKHDFYHHFFAGMSYVGMDISGQVIDYCRDNHARIPSHIWSPADFLEAKFLSYRYDLVFSHAVIDHSPDPDAFVRKCVTLANRWVYIKTYRGYFEDLPKHKIEQSSNAEDPNVYVDVSVPQIEGVLRRMAAKNQVSKYELLPVPTGRTAEEIATELHIVIEI